MWNRRRHTVTCRFIEFCYRLLSVILNSFIITCVVRHFNFPESKIRGHIVFALSVCLCSKIGTGASVFHKRILFGFEILLHPSFFFFKFCCLSMMISCIFWYRRYCTMWRHLAPPPLWVSWDIVRLLTIERTRKHDTRTYYLISVYVQLLFV